jgi:hypothetical protein
MNAAKKPDPRIVPLPQETTPELAGAFLTYVKVLGFVPNSVLIMQRKPNEVTDDLFTELKHYWSEDQIVEIVAVISMFGFMNRWNDTMATPLEEEPIHVGEKHLAKSGWTAGKHVR